MCTWLFLKVTLLLICYSLAASPTPGLTIAPWQPRLKKSHTSPGAQWQGGIESEGADTTCTPSHRLTCTFHTSDIFFVRLQTLVWIYTFFNKAPSFTFVCTWWFSPVSRYLPTLVSICPLQPFCNCLFRLANDPVWYFWHFGFYFLPVLSVWFAFCFK